MSAATPLGHDTAATSRPTGSNGADLRYLEEARTALLAVMLLSVEATRGSGGADSRHLASAALAVQTGQLASISSCLIGTHRPAPASAEPVDAAEPVGHPTSDVNATFADALAAHAHSSIAAARIEMVAGVSRTVRAIARDAIRDQSRQLAALGSTPTPN